MQLSCCRSVLTALLCLSSLLQLPADILTLQGRTTLFMPRLPASYGVWMGVIQGPDYYKAKYAVDDVAYVDDMASVLAAAAAPCIHLLSGTNTDRCELQGLNFES
jgi:hypothetical protein